MSMLVKAKEKASVVASKIESSKVWQKGSKVLTAVSASGIGMAVMGITSSAEAVDWGATITAASAITQIADGASNFVEPAIIIMCAVAGLKLGMRLLRGSTH